MKIVAISATPVVVKSIMQDSLRPQFKSRVTVMQKAGTSIAEMKMTKLTIDKIIIFDH